MADAEVGALNGSLVTVGSPVENEQLRTEEQTKLTSPEAVAAREASQTKFEGLTNTQADKLAEETFPSVIGEQAGGPPRLAAGEQITGYLGGDAARVDLPEGKRGVIESSRPIAIEDAPGQWAPVDLALSESAGGFGLARPAVALSIPKRLQEGVGLSGGGVSLTPVAGSGSAVGGSEGVIDGAAAFYGGVELGSDVDVLVKPTTAGFEEDAILRSVRSPDHLSFRLGLPEGAVLHQAGAGVGPVEILEANHPIAAVLPPSAMDAAGTEVPVSMSVSGNVLTLSVDEHEGEYQYPIDVDPTVEATGNSFGTGWQFVRYPEHEQIFCGIENEGVSLGVEHCPFEAKSYVNGDYGDLLYTTEGESKITEFRAYTYMSGEIYGEEEVPTYMAIAHSSYEVGPVKLGNSSTKTWHEVSAAGSNGNTAIYEVVARENGGSNFESLMYDSVVLIQQEATPHVSMDTSEEVVNSEENALYGNRWVSGTTGKWGFKASASDAGLGLSSETWSSPSAAKWGITHSLECKGVQCKESASPAYSVKGSGSEGLPEGEDTVELKVKDPLNQEASTGLYKVKVDNAPPHGLTLSGLPSTHEIRDGQHILLKASATSALAGMASIELTMDGQVVGTPAKGCSTDECTATGEWTLGGEPYAAGTYTLTVVATDNAGNVSTESYSLTIHHAAGIQVGPASVNPVTGELGLSATDVALSAPGGALTVERSYRSRHFATGTEGPLGPQWTLSLGAEASLSRTLNGNMALTSADGEQSVFASNGKGGYTSPAGDNGLLLSEKTVGSSTDFQLSENGSVTTFVVPSGSSGSVWEPSSSEGPSGTDLATYTYITEGGVIKPYRDRAPVPAGVSCGTPTKGCRELAFVYYTETTASGEGPSQWGKYKGRLAEVTYTAYEPTTKAMATKTVAEYVYDKQGRLRAEWDPTIEPAPLKTVYGYDTEGHVTALAPPGQQPWLFEQGTTTSDAAPGRVIAVARPAATSEVVLKTEMEAAAPVNTVAPTLSSTTPTVGVKLSVNLTSEKTPGTWSNGPLAYSYQWEDCNSAGKECTAIPGAVNQSYYPGSADEGHTLVAQVFALNVAGTTMASSAVTGIVAKGIPSTQLPEPPYVGSLSVWTVDYQVPLSGTGVPQMGPTEVGEWGQTDDPAEATAVFPPDTPMGWPAKEYTRASISYIDDRDRNVNVSSPTGGISTTEYNLYNDVLRTLSPDNRAKALAAGKEKSSEVANELATESTYLETGNEPGTQLTSTLGPKHGVELVTGAKEEARDRTSFLYNEHAPEGGPYHLVTTMFQAATLYGSGEEQSRVTKDAYGGQNDLGWKLREPTAVTIEPSGVDLTHSTFYEPKTGGVTETRMPAAGAPGEELGDSFAFQFGKAGTGSGQLKEPQGITVTTKGDEYVLDTGNNRVEEFNTKGTLVRTFGSEQLKEPRGIALGPEGAVWVANTGDNAIDKYSSEGRYETDVAEGLKAPQGLTVNSEGVVWVANTGDNKITKITYNKEYNEYYTGKSYGAEGAGDAQFKEPQGIAIGAEGNFYMADTGNNRIEELSSSGTFIRTWGWGVSNGKAEYEICTTACKAGIAGSGTKQLNAPHGIATDSAGGVWVADTGNNRIDGFGPTGTYIETFGKEGTTEGKLKAPKGIAIDAEGNAWIADTANSNIQEWTPNGTGYGSGTATAHDTQTIYYTAGANSEVAACGEHAEWAPHMRDTPCGPARRKPPQAPGHDLHLQHVG